MFNSVCGVLVFFCGIVINVEVLVVVVGGIGSEEFLLGDCGGRNGGGRGFVVMMLLLMGVVEGVEYGENFFFWKLDFELGRMDYYQLGMGCYQVFFNEEDNLELLVIEQLFILNLVLQIVQVVFLVLVFEIDFFFLLYSSIIVEVFIILDIEVYGEFYFVLFFYSVVIFFFIYDEVEKVKVVVMVVVVVEIF